MWRSHRVALALALLVIVVVGPVVAPDSAQPASRITLSAALVEHGTVDLGRYRDALGVDIAEYQGHLRSDKAPGQPILAVPAYALSRLVGAESATKLRVHENLGLWWVTFWSSILPLAVLAALLYTACRRFSDTAASVWVALLLTFSTMLLPYGANLFGHVLATCLGFGAWMLIEPTPTTSRRVVLAGLLASTAVFVEYDAAIVAIVLAGYLAVREWRRIVPFGAGAVIPMVALALYQWSAFGAPWRTPAGFYAGVVNTTDPGGYTLPTPADIFEILGGSRGMWVGAPIALVGLGSAVWLVYSARSRVRVHAVIALAIVVPFIVLCAGWSGTPLLEDAGPRYMIPALPFIAVPLAATWLRVRVIAIPVAGFGALIAASATWVQLLVPRGTSLLTADRYGLQHRDFGPTLWSMAFGPFGVILYALTVAGAAVVLVRACRYRTDVRSPVAEPVR